MAAGRVGKGGIARGDTAGYKEFAFVLHHPLSSMHDTNSTEKQPLQRSGLNGTGGWDVSCTCFHQKREKKVKIKVPFST